MWPRSSQNLELQIVNYGIISFRSSNLPQVYGCGSGHGILWIVITKKRNNTLNTSFFTQSSLRREFFIIIIIENKCIGFLKGWMSTSIGFLGHLSLGR